MMALSKPRRSFDKEDRVKKGVDRLSISPISHKCLAGEANVNVILELCHVLTTHRRSFYQRNGNTTPIKLCVGRLFVVLKLASKLGSTC